MALRAEVLERDGYTCGYCGRPAQEVDHRLPLARGGSDNPANLVAACRCCNLAKGAR
jgi:5-methylcytosine-specific restriction endonuclease McrA